MKDKKTKKKGFLGITSRVLMLMAAGVLVLSYVSMLINPATSWGFTLLGLMFIPLALFNFILLLWAIKRRSRSFVIPFLAILPSFFFLGRYVQVDGGQEPSGEPTLKIVSYNVGRFAACEPDSVFSFLRSQDPDVVCLQEFHVSDVDNVRRYLRRHMKGYKSEFYLFPMADGSAFGNVTLSKMPVKGKGKMKFDESANLAIYTDYEHCGRTFRVYNCHFESYSISLPGVVRGVFNADRAVMTATGSKMKRSITRRPKQVDKVFSDIENCSVDAFVCGDFNDNPMSYTYYRMTRGRKDAFVKAGGGFGATYARLWPLLRIDYVLVPDRFKAVDCQVHRVGYSDHFPVVAEINF